MPLTDPVPSSAFDVLERNVQDTDKFVNQEAGTFTNRVGKQVKPIPVIETEANAAVISLGWHQVGLFADGFTYTLQNDIAKDAAGDWYRWNGTLPKIVTAVTLPSSDANFVKIDYKSHAELSDRNPADGSAHNADDIKDTTNGGSVQDFIDESKPKLDSFATDGKITGSNNATAAAAVAVNGIRTKMNCHAFEDWTKINATDSNLGYSSFDAQAVLDTANDVDHYVGYQSRNIVAGSGNITGYCHGYTTQIQHHGTGNIIGVVGVSIGNPTITNGGTIGEVVGLLIEEMNNGTTRNYAIYVAGKAPAHFDCPIELASAVANSTIRQGAGWIWTDTGSAEGTKRGGIYTDSGGQLHLFAGEFSDFLVGNEGGVQANKDFTAEAKFAANGAKPQGKAAVNAAATDLTTTTALVNQLRAALIANGICI